MLICCVNVLWDLCTPGNKIKRRTGKNATYCTKLSQCCSKLHVGGKTKKTGIRQKPFLVSRGAPHGNAMCTQLRAARPAPSARLTSRNEGSGGSPSTALKINLYSSRTITFYTNWSQEDPNFAPPWKAAMCSCCSETPTEKLRQTWRPIFLKIWCILSFTSLIVSDFVMKNVVFFLSKTCLHF